MALGSSNREIAHELYLSVDTVKTHVRTLFQKLGVSNRTQAALAAGAVRRRSAGASAPRAEPSTGRVGSASAPMRQRMA